MFLNFHLIYSQVLITGNINISSSISNVERNFSGFNNGGGFMDVLFRRNNPNAGLESNLNFYTIFNNISNNAYFRFPGGTVANFYNRYYSGFGNQPMLNLQWKTNDNTYLPPNINITNRNNIYQNYENYVTPNFPNASSNIIFPFIYSITQNKQYTAKGNFVVNISNHYRQYSEVNFFGTILYANYNSRTETFVDSNKIKAITSISTLNSSTLSTEYKNIINQNLDAYLTLVKNGVYVDKVELGNETVAYCSDENFTNFINYTNQDYKVWNRDYNSNPTNSTHVRSLSLYANIARMYRLLIKDALYQLSITDNSYTNLYNSVKFGIPITEPFQSSGFQKWNTFMLLPYIKNYIGFDAYIMHPYAGINLSGIGASNTTTTIASDFDTIRDRIKREYLENTLRTKFVNFQNIFPSGSKIWLTEWNIAFNITKVGNTLLGAMSYYDAIMTFLDINAKKNLITTASVSNFIDLANYHAVCNGDASDYATVGFPGGYASAYTDPLTTTNSVPLTIKYNSTYYAHLLLKPILDNPNIKYLNNTNGGFTPTTNCDFRTFLKSYFDGTNDRNDIYIYFDNKSDVNYKIDINSALPIFSGTQVVTKNYLVANNLYASMGKTKFRTDDKIYITGTTYPNAADVSIQRKFNEIVPTGTYDQILIPKYSVGYVLVERSTYCPTCGRYSNPKQVIDKVEEKDFNIYPNPTKDKLTIDLFSTQKSTGNIEIYNMEGKLVQSNSLELSEGNNSTQIDVSLLPSASYIVKINYNETSVSKKIEIIK